MPKKPKNAPDASDDQKPGSSGTPAPEIEQPRAPLFPVVGIGASAGGLDAFTRLLKNLPKDTGMAFVLIQHLSPEHESALTEILARATAMPVSEITDGTRVEPNCVYVIPPNADLTVDEGVLKLLPRPEGRTPPHPVDVFLKSLAEDRSDCSIGVILSGTAHDGTLGLQSIKEAGGITFAQDGSAQYDGMPQSAIASGAVDLVLAPEAIASELARISQTPYLTLRDTIQPSGAPTEGKPATFNSVLALLRKSSSVDFSLYKPATIQRRIMRRLVLSKVETLAQYLQILHENPAELQLLHQDLLISVTSFFRDPEAFESLKQTVFPRLLEQRSQDDPIRIWVVGCSTGQEVYSIVMSYLEVAGDRNIPFKVFATDVSESSLDQARAGIYPKSLLQEISPQRLRRFFVEVAGGYQINKAIRECCVFARHNIVSDPPFSRMDLISCRNLLIYLEPVLQKRVLPMFHYALRPSGFLFLGASESIGGFDELFATQDKPHKLYSRKTGPARAQLGFPVTRSETKIGIHFPNVAPSLPAHIDSEREADRIMARYLPAGVLVNADLEIVQYRGDTAAYLGPAPGKPSHNLLKMARTGLLLPLRELIEKVKKERVAARLEEVRVEHDKGSLSVALEVIPVRSVPSSQRFLVLFHPLNEIAKAPPPGTSDEPDASLPVAETEEMVRLKRDLAEMQSYMQSVTERNEATNEELQAAGEEMQSANEELQSINEELETSKEELQATNEELTTVNEELNNRNRETGLLNDDLNNLINSVAVSIVILGSDFRIRRFTPAAEKLLNIRVADLGRSLGEIRLGIQVPDLDRLMAESIETVSPRELEVPDSQGCWYLLRIRPYITLDRKIDGVVLIFTDVDALKQSELRIKGACDYAESILRTAPNPLLVLDAELRVVSTNQAFHDTFKTLPVESLGRLIYDLGNGQWNNPQLRQLLEEILPGHRVFNNFEVTHDFESIGRCTMLLNARMLDEMSGQPAKIVLGVQNITQRKQAEEDRIVLSKLESTGVLAGGIAHDFNNLLNATLLNLDLSKAAATAAPDAMPWLDAARKSTVAAQQLTKQLITFAKGGAPVRKPVQLSELIHASTMLTLSGTNIRSDVSVDQDLHWTNVDEGQIGQVVRNLLLNARDAMPNGGLVIVRAQNLVLPSQDGPALPPGQYVRVTVSDHGLGIPPEMLPKIFDPYFSTKARGTDKGLGLGLTICHTIIRKHEGMIAVQSKVGVGTTFQFYLPACPKPATVAAGENPAATTAQFQLKSPKVLVMDDDDCMRSAVQAILEVRGFEIVLARHGQEALDLFSKAKNQGCPFDAVILDLTIRGGMGGKETMQELLKIDPAVKALVMSGYSEDPVLMNPDRYGFKAGMEKSFDADQLSATLARIIGT